MEKSVTISCRVTPEVKTQLVQRSETLGVKLCSLVELLVLNQLENDLRNVGENAENDFRVDENDDENEDLIKATFQALISHLSDNATQSEIFEKHLNILQEKHKNSTEVELVNACLIHAVTNDKALWQRNLSVFLNRLKDGKYDN